MAHQLNIVCPSCGAVNRAPQSRLDSAEIPVCGNCKKVLFDGHPLELSSEKEFMKHILRNDIPVVIEFWAAWCGPCRMMTPEFAAVTRRLEPRFRFAKINTEIHDHISLRYDIRGIPALILFQNGREIARQNGAMNSSAIEDWIEKKTASLNLS